LAASIIVRARQVIPALAANQLAALRLEPLGTDRAVTYGMLRGRLLLVGLIPFCTSYTFCPRGRFHGPKVIAQPGRGGKKQNLRTPDLAGASKTAAGTVAVALCDARITATR
jgi:hypothetical protein